MKTKHVQLKINPQEHVIVQLDEPMLFDKLHTLSVEYSVSMDLLVNRSGIIFFANKKRKRDMVCRSLVE